MKNIFKTVLLVSLFGVFIVPSFTFQKAYADKPVTTVKAEHILVDTEEEALALKKRIENGESFEELARAYSKCPSKEKGGSLGFFGRGQMAKEFEDAAFSLPVGQVSEPIKTQFGWHLIKVLIRI